jgi:radical SAM superfamily enzyme YgiQ (UPF0313 family)
MISPGFPAFNVYSRLARETTALGPLSVATIVSKMHNWDVEVIDENNYRRPGPRDAQGLPDHTLLQTMRPVDTVGLYGGLSSTIPRLFEISEFYKSVQCTVIAGGQHFVGENVATAFEHGIDYVVVGEGEETIRELLTALEENRSVDEVRGIAYLKDGQVVTTQPRPPIVNFDTLPLPDYDLINYARITYYPVNWVRGCGMNCEFCTVKGRPRSASVEQVFRQISSLVETRRAREFFVVDDLFGYKRSETLRFCHLMAKYQSATRTRLHLTVQIRLDRANDTKLLKAMRAAGIDIVCVGFESPIAEELEAMNKKVRPAEMIHKALEFHKAEFLVHGMFIFGYPLVTESVFELSTKERIRRFRQFIRKAKLDTIQVLLPVPLPGTELTARLESQGRVFPRDLIGWEYYDGNFPLIEPDPPLTPEDMLVALHKVMGGFYQFQYLFAIGGNILSFTRMIFFLFNLRLGWRLWYRSWRNDLKRFGGWLIIQHWKSRFKSSHFLKKLTEAKAACANS